MSIKSVSELPERHIGRPYGRITRDIIEFMDSGMQICELSTDGYKNVNTATTTARQSVTMLGCHVAVIRRGNRVFLINMQEAWQQ